MPTKPQGLTRQSYFKRQVEGLREVGDVSEVRVFRANPDGSIGEFIGVEPATQFAPNFTRTTPRRGKQRG